MRFLVLLFIFGIQTEKLLAFSEMVRIGYQNCTACHISPTGGGVMTPYGRGMAADILSTWSYKGEESIGHGVIKNQEDGTFRTPDWLHLGGESRWIQTYIDNVQATRTQWFPMQNEFEAAFNASKAWFVGSLNTQGGPAGAPNLGLPISSRMYVMYYVNDEIYLRAGKFLIPFGIYQPDHTAVINRNLGWGLGSETQNVETGYIGEKFNFLFTGSFGRFDNPNVQAEKGLSVNFAYNLLTNYKLGWSAFSGDSLESNRLVTGPYALLGFTRDLVLLSQADLQWKKPKDTTVGPEERGFVAFNRLQYEIAKGVHPFVIHQVSYLNTNGASSRYDSYGGGVIWYPRPHFELWANWEKERNMSASSVYTDSAWLVFHYYL